MAARRKRPRSVCVAMRQARLTLDFYSPPPPDVGRLAPYLPLRV